MSAPQIESAVPVAGGTVFTIILNVMAGVPLGEIAVNAVVGTVVSYFALKLIKWIEFKIKNRNGKIN
jgi:hypothetical protein